MGGGASAGVATALKVSSLDELRQTLDALPAESRSKLAAAVGAADATKGAGDTERIAQTVCKVLRKWASIDPAAVVVEKQGPWVTSSSVYKVIPPADSKVPAVVFQKKDVTPTTLRERRTACARKIFGDAGVSPSRLAESGSWWIEPWFGVTFNDATPRVSKGTFKGSSLDCRIESFQAATDLGRLIARVHAIPTGWFDEFCEETYSKYPWARDLPEGNFLLMYQHFQGANGEDFDAVMQKHSANPESLKALLTSIPTPKCPALSRVVTAHGNLSDENILYTIRDGEGFVACGDESACVMSAIWDFMHAQIRYFEEETKAVYEVQGENAHSYTHALMETYLQESGFPCGHEDVEAALFEIRSFTDALYMRDSMDAIFMGDDRINISFVEEFASRFRKNFEDPVLRGEVLKEPHIAPCSYLADLVKHRSDKTAGPYIRSAA